MPLNLRTIKEVSRRDILFSVARLPRASRLLLGSSDFKIHDLDVLRANPQSQELVGHTSYVTSVRLAGQTLISGSYDGKLIWWDFEQRRPIRTIDSAHRRWIRGLAVSPDGAILASVADDMVCRLWNIADGTKIRDLQGHQERTPSHFTSMLYTCVFSADGRHLATGDRIGHVVIWETATGRQVGAIDAPLLYTWDGVQRNRSIGGVRALAFSPDGRQLAVGGVGQIGNVDALQGPTRVEIFDWARNQRIGEFTGPNGIINHVQFHPQNDWLLAIGGGSSGIAMFYHVGRRSMLHQGNAPMHVHDATFNEDFTTLYAAGHNKIVVMEVRNT
jgi:WD40 repeat protein